MELSWRSSCRWESLSHISLAGMECLFPLGTCGYRMYFLCSDQSTVSMSRYNAILYILRFSSSVFPCLASFCARQICDTVSKMDLIASRALKKSDDFLVGYDLPQMSLAMRLLIFTWTKFSVPIICSLSPASYLVAGGSGGIDPICMHIVMSWHTAVHSVPVLVPSRLRDMTDTANVLPWSAATDEHVKTCSISSYSPQ
jgi:hypothetical protein